MFSRRTQFLNLLLYLFRPPARLEMQAHQVLQIRVLARWIPARKSSPAPAFKFVFSSHDSSIAFLWERSTSG